MSESLASPLGVRVSGGQLSSKRIIRGLREATPLFSEPNYARRFPTVKRGRKGTGLRFERKVCERLAARYPFFLPSLAVRYRDSGGSGVCIPDGILFRERELVVFECKLSHTPRAYWELEGLYAPVLRRAFGLPVRVAEITLNYDPTRPFPVECGIFREVREFLDSDFAVGVILWR